MRGGRFERSRERACRSGVEREARFAAKEEGEWAGECVVGDCGNMFIVTIQGEPEI